MASPGCPGGPRARLGEAEKGTVSCIHMTRYSLDTWRQGHLCHYSQGGADAHLTGEARYHRLAGKGFPHPQSESPAPSSALSVGLFSPSSLAPPAVPEQDMDPSISPAGEESRACKQLNPAAGLTPYLPHSQPVIRT